MTQVRVSAIERAIAKRFPVERAEPWDRVGLLAGDPEAVVTGVALALDPTRAAIAFALEHDANVLVTHHPAYLKAPEWITPGRGPSGVVFAALSAQVALVNAHTNLDRDAAAQGLTPSALGLEPVKPVERQLQTLAMVTVFVPESHVDRVTAAMVGAGAGRIGDYEGCSFTGTGTGAFTPPADSRPCAGEPGSPSQAAELRVEMVCPVGSARGVVGAAVSAHPYEEPLVAVHEVQIARNAARLGMVARIPGGASISLEDLAARAAAAYEVTPRVWGAPGTPVATVACATGSAGSLVGDAVRSGAQALVAGEVRYHDALEAVEAGLAVVEIGHDASEWPLVGLLADAVRTTPGLDDSRIHVMPAATGWWTP